MLTSLLKARPINAISEFRRYGSKLTPELLEKLDKLYKKLHRSQSKSLLKRFLRPAAYKRLRKKTTKNATLLDCIQSGLLNHDSGCGVYAPEPEAYKVFADLFDPIIQEYHFGFKKSDKQPACDFGNVREFEDLDPLINYIASTRIRCARSIKGFPFNPTMAKKHYEQIQDLLHCVLSNLGGEFHGKFFPLTGMKKKVQQKLIDDHYLFKEGDRFLQAANSNRFWPTGRGIYLNFDKTFLVWCNEEDHIRIISMQRGGHIGQVYGRLIRGVQAIGECIPFERDERLGFLTFCPTNLGTTIRASVHIRVPKLASNPKKLQDVANKFKLQVRGTRGEHSEAEGGIYDVSNRRRLGVTEYEAVKELYCGVIELIKLEKKSTFRQRKRSTKPKKERLKPATSCLTHEQYMALTDPMKAKMLRKMREKRKKKKKKKDVECFKHANQKAKDAARKAAKKAAAGKDPKAAKPAKGSKGAKGGKDAKPAKDAKDAKAAKPKRDCRPLSQRGKKKEKYKCYRTKQKPGKKKKKGVPGPRGGHCAPEKDDGKKKVAKKGKDTSKKKSGAKK